MKKVAFTVNGRAYEVIADEDLVLLDVLRNDLHLTGAKQSCDRKGQCGACTVIVNGEAVLSCLTKVKNLEGAEVITVEGLGIPDNPHLIQEAFVLAGAIQCGFCTPGMIMGAKALLDKNTNPTVEEIKKALRRNLCRCTGYTRIIEAVQLAGRFLRGEATPDQLRPDPSAGTIGVSHPRPSSYLKACGTARFGADIIVPGALELAAVRSPHYNARIKSIGYAEAEKMPGVVGILTAKDIKGSNNIGLIMKDEPVLCPDIVPVMGAPVAAVVALTKEEALAAAKAVRVDYEVLPRLATAEEALAEGAPQIHSQIPNVPYQCQQIKGDAGKALQSSAQMVEVNCSTQLIHQAPLEPEVAIAYMDGEGEDAQLVVIGRSIWIHAHTHILQDALGWGNVRYFEPFSGGQFGIKADITSEGLAAAAALKFKRPVRYIPSLAESMLMSPKRHPYGMKVRIGADAGGKITGYWIDITVENGAYSALGPMILNRSLEMLSGPYNLPNVKAEAKLVYTNDGWGSAARGAGPPQINFALEVAVDMLAAKMNIDPFEFRMRNSLRPGESMSTGHVAEEWAFLGCLERMKPFYEKARTEVAAHKKGATRRGLGLGGVSFGVGGAQDTSNVAVELDSDGGLSVYASTADPGEGNDAMMTQLAAHCMNLPLNKIRLISRDTEPTPDSGVSAGSRQTYMSGGALVQAIDMLKAAMKEAGAKSHADLVKAGKPTRYLATRTLSHKGLDPKTGQGVAWDSRIHGIQLVEVEVNTETGETKVLKVTTVVDTGTVINPLAVLGQVEGGADMGAGMALREHYVLGKTKDWVTFKYPTMETSFPMETILLESPRARGPLGATGVGEFTSMPTHPAIANAVYDAIGVRISDLPITPEKILAALGKK